MLSKFCHSRHFITDCLKPYPYHQPDKGFLCTKDRRRRSFSKMAGEADPFLTVEWTVSNISCWNRKIHGRKITSPVFKGAFDLISLRLELYPKGSGRGDDKKVAVRLCYRSNSDFSGDFLLLSADRRPAWAHELRAEEGEGALELTCAGPAFDDLAAGVAEEVDHVILKCRVSGCWDSGEVHHARTAIGVSDSAWRLSPTSFRVDDEELGKFLATIRYEEEGVELSLLVFPKNALVLQPEQDRKVFVVTRLSAGARVERKEHLFVDRKRWTLCDSLTSDEVASDVLLWVRVVHRSCRHECDVVYAPEDIAEVGPESFTSLFSKGATDDGGLCRDLEGLYRDQEYADFRIRCGDASFPVHRAVLSARSPFFRTMLSCGMREAASGAVDVTDIDPDTLDLFLTFLYTGEVGGLDGESALSLYYAADKYQDASLKRMCGDFLSANVSVSNVCDVLSLADRHQDERLRSAAQDFILENFNTVVTSSEWEGFLEGEPVLADRTLTSVSAKRGK